MMRYRYIAVLACCLGAAACSDRPTQPVVATPQFEQQGVASTCPTVTSILIHIERIVPAGGDRAMVLERFRQIVRLMGPEPPGPNVPEARAQAFVLIQLLLDMYRHGSLIGGQSAATQARLQFVLNGILCTVGLPPAFGPGSLGPDGAAAIISPTTRDTTIVTETQWAGLNVPAASVTQPTVVTIRRLPDSPGPLLTALDQYPIYYEYSSSPAMPFNQDLVVGICVASNFEPPDPTRLRLAHNVAPFTPGSAAILPLAAAPFIDCTNAPIASGYSRWGFDLARAGGRLQRGMAGLLLPQPLLALPFYGSGGVGGTVRTFSPFGAVDTLGTMTLASAIEFYGPANGPANGLPSVLLKTPAGHPMAGIAVTFAIVSGGGSLGGASAVTNASGVATLGSLTLGASGCTRILATATMTAGSGLTGNPQQFFGCVR